MARTLKVPKNRQTRAQQDQGFIVLGPLRHNIVFENWYMRLLTDLTKQMTDDVSAQVRAFYQTRTAKAYFAQDSSILSQAEGLFLKLETVWNKTFNRLATPYAQQMVAKANDNSGRALKRSLDEIAGTLAISTTMITPRLKTIIEASVEESVILINSIPVEYFKEVKGAIVRSITQPNTGGMRELTATIDTMLDDRARIIHNKAKNLALDQTRKSYNNINAARMQAVGINDYVWIHSRGGQHPRPLHLNVLNNQQFSLSDPPVIDEKTGARGIPGQAINCKCIMRPVVKFG